MRVLPIAQYPEIAPPVVTVQAVYPGASAEVLEQTVAAPLENADQRRREHALHELDLGLERRGADPGHLRHRRRRRQGGAQREQPRQAGRAAPAARGAPPGRHGGEGLVGVPAGARLLLARRPLRRPLHLELRDAERARRAEARAGHDQRADLRREGLRDADLGQARPPDAAQAHRRRPDPRDQRAERAVRRRQDRAVARPAGRRSSSTRSPPRAGLSEPARVRGHHRALQPRRLEAAPEGRGARRARLARTTSSSAASTASEATLVGVFLQPGANALEVARRRERRRSPSSRRAFPHGPHPLGALRHDALRQGVDPRGGDHARRGDAARLAGGVSSSCRTGARR